MKIRTQIALAFLVFAILPMSVIVLVGYGSSRRAVREALEAEAAVLTVDMEQRMARVRNEITRRVERISELSFSEMMEGEGDQERQAFFASVMSTLGEAAPLVESFEFVPELPPAALAPPRPHPRRTDCPVRLPDRCGAFAPPREPSRSRRRAGSSGSRANPEHRIGSALP